MAISKATIKSGAISAGVSNILANVPGANDDNGAVTQMVTAIVDALTDAIIDEVISNGVVTIPIGNVSTGSSPAVVPNPAPITTLTIS